MPSKRRISLLSWSLLAIWLLATGVVFWWLQLQYQQPFADDLHPYLTRAQAPDTPDALRGLLANGATEGRAKVISFYDPSCPCTRFNTPHRERIEARFAGGKVDFVSIQADDKAALAQHLQQWLPVQKAPAALVLDAEGRLVYYGPFSVGSGCLTGSGTFVERAIQRVLEGGQDAAKLNVLAKGCYCTWPELDGETKA